MINNLHILDEVNPHEFLDCRHRFLPRAERMVLTMSADRPRHPAWIASMVSGLKPLLEAEGVSAISQTPELALLLEATGARAVGCWRHREGTLRLAGFLAADDMQAIVRAEFIAATWNVPLSATQFGIVQAVAIRGPALNLRAANSSPVEAGSLGWLARFEAASSLAVPIEREAELWGTIAVATARRIEPDDDVWRLVVAVAAGLNDSERSAPGTSRRG